MYPSSVSCLINHSWYFDRDGKFMCCQLTLLEHLCLSLLLPPLPSPDTLTRKVLYYNFKEHPDVVFDKVVEIKVFNSKNPITKALIGTFKVTAFYSIMTHSILACLYSIPPTCLDFILLWSLFHPGRILFQPVCVPLNVSCPPPPLKVSLITTSYWSFSNNYRMQVVNT